LEWESRYCSRTPLLVTCCIDYSITCDVKAGRYIAHMLLLWIFTCLIIHNLICAHTCTHKQQMFSTLKQHVCWPKIHSDCQQLNIRKTVRLQVLCNVIANLTAILQNYPQVTYKNYRRQHSATDALQNVNRSTHNFLR